MIATEPATPLTASIRRQLIADYLTGLSVWNLQLKYPHLKRRAVYVTLMKAGVLRRRGESQLGDDPDEAEIARRRDLIKNSWSDEQASRRWVGRSSSKMSEMGHSLSQLIPD
jgi:hypothetical protein